MSKRDDDSQADMEVGMTTAERRRRRRRGGGLRVPSDNVPRRSNPPVVAPVPEDPSLAMSIAYSFQPDSDAARADADGRPNGPSTAADPIAPDAMTTVIDPPTPSTGNEDFEMKTREMSAVDLEALGLTGLDGSSGESSASSSLPGMKQVDSVAKKSSTVEVDAADGGTTLDTEDPDVEIDDEGDGDEPEPPIAAKPAAAETNAGKKTGRERLKTVALSDEDLEEVREAVRAQETAAPVKAATNETSKAPTKEPAKAPISQPIPVATPPGESAANRTQPLSALDIEVIKAEPDAEPPAKARTKSDDVLSVPDIDIQELSERASDSSGEYEVDINEDDEPAAPPAPATPPVAAKPAEQPPARPTPAPAGGTPHSPPPPPPTHAKAPPAPPPAAKKDKPAAAPPPKVEPKRQKAWFVDLFDEDYLRTLPFLTPQATQSEAEFVIYTMQLAPEARVLDIGCGYGRHAMELAARGFQVVGLDLSTPLLVRGGEEAMRRGLSINFVRGDMRELDFDAQFDGAYCLFSTFGYFDDETNKKTLGNIARALKPGGKVVIEILNRDYVIADLPTRVWWEGDGCVVLEEVELNYFSSRIQVNRSVVFDDGRQLEQEISVRAYSLHEVGKLMHAAGFRVLEVSGGYQTRGRFFGNQSRHIIVLAERKDTTA